MSITSQIAAGAALVADKDLALSTLPAIVLFMRRRSAWLCCAGAVMAYIAFVPPLLVVIPLMAHQFCTEWRDGQISLLPDPSPDCSALKSMVDLIPTDFYDKATVSNLSSDFNTPTGRVFLACILLSSLALLISEFSFWLPRRWNLSGSERNFLDEGEGRLRFVWLVVGTLSTAIVSTIPSPAGAKGYELLLMSMHNGGAVLGYSVMVFMELAQLHLGENVFRRMRFALRQKCGRLPDEVADAEVDERDHLKLNWDQWLRGSIMVLELATGTTFVGVQGALFFGLRSGALAYYSVFLETGFALLIYGDLFVMGLHGIVLNPHDVDM